VSRVARTGIFPMVALLGAALTLASVAPMFFSAPPATGPTPKTRCATTLSTLDHVVLTAPSWASAQCGKDAPTAKTTVVRTSGWPLISPAVERGRGGGGADLYIGQGGFRS
jgi:hypothetical protein